MKIIQPTFYKDFKCIAGACPDSCCQGWEVDADSASLKYYATLDPSLDIKKKIDSVLSKDEFGNVIFTLAPKKRCPFLNEENLCDMHIAIGEENTPFTCRNFPRFNNYFGGTKEIGVSFSCPVAAEMMYNLDKWSFEESVDAQPPMLNDIDAADFFSLKKMRDKIYSLLSDRSRHIKDRIISAITLCKEVYYDEKIIDTLTLQEVLTNPELINPEWKERVKSMSEAPVSDTVANENIAFYFIYKCFLASLLEGDYSPLSAVKMAAVGILVNTYCGESAWTVHLWSKETEHSQYNMDRYKRLLNTSDCLSCERLIEMLEK
ncbi:MAG: flagellin lysine-N-methylase [Eubacterium sp.]|nr:flagellin lysine-N-methylase [Eubacterium sp.]